MHSVFLVPSGALSFVPFVLAIGMTTGFFDDLYDAGRGETIGGISDRDVFLFLLLASHYSCILIGYDTISDLAGCFIFPGSVFGLLVGQFRICEFVRFISGEKGRFPADGGSIVNRR